MLKLIYDYIGKKCLRDQNLLFSKKSEFIYYLANICRKTKESTYLELDKYFSLKMKNSKK